MGGFLLYLDFNDFKENLFEEKVVLLNHNNVLVGGFIVKDIQKIENVSFIDSSTIKDYNSKGLEDILGDNFKLFIVDSDMFSDIKDLDFQGKTFHKDYIFSLLNSDDPINMIAEETYSEELEKALLEVPEEFHEQFISDFESQKDSAIESLKSQLNIDDGSQFKGLIFGALISKSLDDPTDLFDYLRSGSLKVYPETIMFKLVKSFPPYLIDFVKDNLPKGIIGNGMDDE